MFPPLNSIMLRLNFRQLRLLIALGEHGSLLKAADEVAITQPGASKALQEIETTFGRPLFSRTNRGLEPNDLGHCVIRYARLMQTDLDHLRQELIGIVQGQGGRLAVGTIMGAVPLLSKALSRLLAARPDISVEIVEDTSAVLLSLLNEGRLDVAICRTSISSRPFLYDSVVIQDETLAVVANTDHPLASKERLVLGDLAQYRWIVYSANMPMRLLLEREFYSEGLRFPLYVIETTSAFTTLSLLRKNSGYVALVSTDVAHFCAEFGLICILNFQLLSRSEPYELVTRRGAVLSPSAQYLMEHLLDTPNDSSQEIGDQSNTV
jgi:DNA-binding transcriptional LysR family regulator